jgi:cell division protein FtsL
VIARPLPYPDEIPSPRTGTRAGRAAVRRRRGIRKRNRYLLLGRIVVTVSVLTVTIGLYLALMANVTRMNYTLSENAQTEATLTDQSARLADEISRLGSRERLAVIAARLGMHESQRFAEVSLPVRHDIERSSGIALLPWQK